MKYQSDTSFGEELRMTLQNVYSCRDGSSQRRNKDFDVMKLVNNVLLIQAELMAFRLFQ